VAWEGLDSVAPADFTLHTAAGLEGDDDLWADHMPRPQRPGRATSVARVQAISMRCERRRGQQ